MTKKYKIPVIIITILLIIILGIGALYLIKKPEEKYIIQEKDNIKSYNYSLKENDSSLKEEKFKELKEILETDNLDEKMYAKSLAEIFVIDVYDLNSKLSKYDIGGLEYLYESEVDKFKRLMQDTLYSNIEDNTLNKREQELPEIVSVTTKEITEGTFIYNEQNVTSWNVEIKIDYKKDLGYDNNVLVTVIKIEQKLYVAEIKPL